MKKKTKEQISLTLGIETMAKVRKMAKEENRNVSNMIDMILEQALKTKSIILLIMFMILVSCSTQHPLLDPNSAAVVNCHGDRGTVRFKTIEGEGFAEADFLIKDCEEFEFPLEIRKK
jgi:hypothetical protein